MRPHWKSYLLALSFSLVASSNVLADGPTLTTIDFPGAASTQAWGINRRGDIVGLYVSVDNAQHGFLLSGDKFTAIDFPGASLTNVFGINPQGDIVGTYATATNPTVTHGFVLSGGRFTTIDFPDATYTGPAGITSRGDVQGLYTLAGVNHGFLLKGDDFYTIDFPGSTSGGVNGFNEREDMVGNYSSAGVTHGYLLRNGSFTSIDYPGATFTGAYGINQRGEVVGRYRDAAGATHAYLLSAGQFTVFDFPGATLTAGNAISDRGDIVGRYTLNGINHAYLWRRSQPQGYTVTDLGTLGGTASNAYGINNAGMIAGGANVAGEDQHAFVWRNGHMTDLGTLGGPNAAATNPNGANQVSIVSETSNTDPLGEDFCGYGTHRTCLAAIWQNGKMTQLPTLGGNNAIGFAINDRGQMVGAAETATRGSSCIAPQALDYVPVIWGPNPGDIRKLPPLAGDTTGFALGLNDKGEAVGSTGTCANTTVSANGLANGTHAVIWQNGVPTDLGNLGMTAVAAAINNRSEVVGGSVLPNGTDVHGFLWTRETGMQDIGTVGSDTSSFPATINNSRQIAGASCDSDMNCRAFLWERNVMTDLNDLVPPDSPLELVFAGWINDLGEIVGQAVNKQTGELRAFLATPANAPPAATAAEGTVGTRANVRKPLGRTWGHVRAGIRRYGAR